MDVEFGLAVMWFINKKMLKIAVGFKKKYYLCTTEIAACIAPLFMGKAELLVYI